MATNKKIAFWLKGKGFFGKDGTPIKEEDLFMFENIISTDQIVNKGPDGVNPYISAKDLISDGSNKIIVRGTLTWISDFKHIATAFTYVINGATYTSLRTELTADPSHATENRTDNVVLTFDASGNGIIKIVKGTNYVGIAVAPIVKDTEIFLTTIDVNGGSTQPVGVTNFVLYDEDETVVDANGANVIGTAPLPYLGTKCILATDFTTGDSFYVKNATDFNPKMQENFLLAIKSESGRWDNLGTIKVALINNANEIISNSIIIYSRVSTFSPFYFDSRKNIWQDISIPILAFNTTSTVARGIVILKDDNRGTDSFKLDFLRFQTGINLPTAVEKTKLSEFEDDVTSLVGRTNDYNDLFNKPTIKAVENEYATWALCVADQLNQTSGGFQSVVDASGHPTVTSGYAYFEYLGTTVGNDTDYRKLSEEESMDLIAITSTQQLLNEGESGVGRYIEDADLVIMSGANLIIEGVGTTINTKALLATKFTFIESEIGAFNIINNTVYATITNTNYETVNYTFKDNADIISFQETNGFLKKFGFDAFRNTPNFKKVVAIGVETFSQYTFYQTPSLYPSKIDLPNLKTVVSGLNFRYMGSDGSKLSFPKLETIAGNYQFHSVVVNVDFPICTDIGNEAFYNAIVGSVINIPNAVNLGTGATDRVFSQCDAGIIINAHYSLETSNAGSPDINLAYAIGRGAIVNYVGGKQKTITASRALTDADNGYAIIIDSAVGINITIDDTLSSGFECEFFNDNIGAATFVAGTGVVHAPDGFILDQDKVCTVFKKFNINRHIIKGEMA